MVDLASGSIRSLAMNRTELDSLSLTPKYAYWLDHGAVGATVETLAVMRVPLDGSGPSETVTTLREGPTSTLADGETVYFGQDNYLAYVTEKDSTPIDLASRSVLELADDHDNLYWTSCGSVDRLSKGGGPVAHLADAFCAIGIGAADGDVYFVDWVDPRPSGALPELRHVAASGGEATTIGVTNGAIAVDERGVYYTGADNGLYRLAKGSTMAQKLASGRVGKIILDDSCVYWTDTDDKAILVLSK